MSDEVARLRAEVQQLQNDRRAAIAHRHDQRIFDRTMPPLAQMTRLQKRYFLEPWMTALAVGSGAIAMAGYVLAMFTWLHVQFAMLGLLFTIVSGAALITKLNFMEWNSRTESQVTGERQRRP